MTPDHPGNQLKAIPPAADTLSEGARQEWQTLAPIIFQLKTGRPADLRILELLCEILADIRSIEAAVRSEGYTVTSSGGPKPHPALRSLESNRR
jgi:phage terminase small subunit